MTGSSACTTTCTACTRQPDHRDGGLGFKRSEWQVEAQLWQTQGPCWDSYPQNNGDQRRSIGTEACKGGCDMIIFVY